MRKTLLGCAAVVVGSLGFAHADKAMAQSDTNLAPGQIKVRLNGELSWYAGQEASSIDSTGSGKTSTSNFYGYIRLYPGFDGVAANGLHYGGAMEIRDNSGLSSNDETLYVFEAYGYLGLPKLGQVSFGDQNGPNVIFQTGTFESFNDGGWDGYIEAMIPGAAQALYPWADGNNNYSEATNKIVYLSPQISGFQFAVGFTPNQTSQDYAPALVSTTTPIEDGMPRNMVDVGGQYTKNFGPVGVQFGADYTTAGQVAYTGGETSEVTNFHNLNVFQTGLTATYDGFTVGGNAVYGNYTVADSWDINMEPEGGTPGVAWLVGAQYTAGPFTVGSQFFHFTQTGDLPGGIDAGSGATINSDGLTTGQQQNTGFALGGTYTIVPGVSLFVDYLYGTREQGGYDFATGNAGVDHNEVQSQLFGVGTQIQW